MTHLCKLAKRAFEERPEASGEPGPSPAPQLKALQSQNMAPNTRRESFKIQAGSKLPRTTLVETKLEKDTQHE
jgi:hypothetical protein